MKQSLKKSLSKAPVIKKGNYSYVIHPLTDGIPEISPNLLKEVIQQMKERIQPFLPLDKIVTIEAMGIPFATALSLELGIPFTILRKRSYGLPDEISIKQITGYSKAALFMNGVHPKDKIIVVDDVLSTGGTLRAVLQAMQSLDVEVKSVITVVNKGVVAEDITKDTGVPINSLLQVEIIDDKIVFKEESI